MARADLLVNLVKAGSKGDQSIFQKITENIIAEERDKKHYVLAERLSSVIRENRGRHIPRTAFLTKASPISCTTGCRSVDYRKLFLKNLAAHSYRRLSKSNTEPTCSKAMDCRLATGSCL